MASKMQIGPLKYGNIYCFNLKKHTYTVLIFNLYLISNRHIVYKYI